MAEISRLFLPPPGSGGPQPPARGGIAGSVQGVGGGRPLARRAEPGAEGEGGAESAAATRAKNFRFRVLDGGRQDNSLVRGATGDPNRAGATRKDVAGESAGPAASPTPQDGAGFAASASAGATGFQAFAPFLAQLIAQEQLRPGLYDPPLRAADRAYRLAGAAPPLGDAVAGAAVSIRA